MLLRAASDWAIMKSKSYAVKDGGGLGKQIIDRQPAQLRCIKSEPFEMAAPVHLS